MALKLGARVRRTQCSIKDGENGQGELRDPVLWLSLFNVMNTTYFPQLKHLAPELRRKYTKSAKLRYMETSTMEKRVGLTRRKTGPCPSVKEHSGSCVAGDAAVPNTLSTCNARSWSRNGKRLQLHSKAVVQGMQQHPGQPQYFLGLMRIRNVVRPK